MIGDWDPKFPMVVPQLRLSWLPRVNPYGVGLTPGTGEIFFKDNEMRDHVISRRTLKQLALNNQPQIVQSKVNDGTEKGIIRLKAVRRNIHRHRACGTVRGPH